MVRSAMVKFFYNMDSSLQENEVNALTMPYAYGICWKLIK